MGVAKKLLELAVKAAREADEAAPLAMDRASRMARAKDMGLTRKVYHGTRADVREFSPSQTGAVGRGVYVSPDPMIAGDYTRSDVRPGAPEGGNIMPLLAPKGPYASQPQFFKLVGDFAKTGMDDRAARDAATAELANRGFKGISFRNNLAVFDPADLRSRFAAFDPAERKSKDITKARGGLAVKRRRARAK
jgi:hypothetical protein